MTDSLIIKELGVDIEVHGYYLLLKAPVIPEKTKGGIYTPDSYRNNESRAPNVGLVLKMGPQAYLPSEKFGGKPRCEVGDWVIYSMYERQEEKINGHLCYFIADERILATLTDIDIMMKKV